MDQYSTKPDEEEEVAHDFFPLMRVYKNGRIERLVGTDIVPPSLHPNINVQSKDVVYSHQLNLSSRIYLPQNTNQKLPILVYYHGGGFVVETPFSHNYHRFCNILASEANIIIVSVDYRRAPEDLLPAGYDDSWTALKWVASHFNGNGPEEWINSYADLSSLFLGGDSAGANIAHNMAMRNGGEKLSGINLVGIVLIHPYFWGKEPVGNEVKDPDIRLKINGIWYFSCSSTSGCDDPLINPASDPNFGNIGCCKVLVFVAEKDFLKSRGWFYHDTLKKIGWEGSVEVIEAKEENHVFHLFNPQNDNAKFMFQKIASFIYQDKNK